VGVRLKDVDLMGIPFKVIAGRALAEGKVEFKERSNGQMELLALDSAAKVIQQKIEEKL